MKKNANKGFSLVELIIVIAIMAVLIGVLAPQFIKQVEKSRESTDLQNIEEIKTATETFVADYAEKIPSTTTSFTVTVDRTNKVIKGNAKTGDAATDKNLTEYGVPSDGYALKSGKWTADIVWTYNLTGDNAYQWVLTTDGSATYFNAEGEPQ